MTDLLQRALITRIEVLEKECEEWKLRAGICDANLMDLVRFVFPERGEAALRTVGAPDLIDELKRRGLGNGKGAGE